MPIHGVKWAMLAWDVISAAPDRLVARLDWTRPELLAVFPFRHTVETGFATFWSRSRRKLWLKGESSGHRLVVKEIETDCDQDAILVKVEPQGPGVCHEGYESCFFRRLDAGEWKVAEPRSYDPDAVYGGKA